MHTTAYRTHQVRRVFDNCYLYNGKGHAVTLQADEARSRHYPAATPPNYRAAEAEPGPHACRVAGIRRVRAALYRRAPTREPTEPAR
jgi:hypothetical protein